MNHKTTHTTRLMTIIHHSDSLVMQLFADVITCANMTRREYRVSVRDSQDQECYNERFDTLSAALHDVHRFNMSDFANSVYAIDDDDESAYDSFR